MSARGFVGVSALFALAALALAWAFVALAPLAFLDREYAAWAAKSRMLARCDISDLLILGDSRAAAGIIPARLPRPALNLALGGGEAVEALAALRRALACPHRPKRVLLSFGPGQFVHPDLFWERTVAFGFFGPAEIRELASLSRAAKDWSVYENGHGDGLDGGLRAVLYTVRFPGLYLQSLMKAGGFLRLWENRRALASALDSRGQYFFGTAPGNDQVAVEGHLEAFRPLPVLDLYFDRLLSSLAENRISVILVPMPINRATAAAIRPGVARSFERYLRGYQARYPNVKMAGPTLNGWPDSLFGDAFSHLNPRGAALFSDRLASCLQGGACDLAWRPGADGTASP